MSYSVDTSALIDAWVRYYPRDVFGTIWKRIDDLARKGRLLAIDEVRRELEKQDDDLHAWVKDRPEMIVPLDEEIQEAAALIINRFPSLTNTKSVMSGAADPFVISLAKVRNLIVVHAEQKKPSNPKIPDVCDAIGIQHFSLLQLFRTEGWKL